MKLEKKKKYAPLTVSHFSLVICVFLSFRLIWLRSPGSLQVIVDSSWKGNGEKQTSVFLIYALDR